MKLMYVSEDRAIYGRQRFNNRNGNREMYYSQVLEEVQRMPGGVTQEVYAECREAERGRPWGIVLYQDPLVECFGVPTLGLDWLIQAKRVGFCLKVRL